MPPANARPQNSTIVRSINAAVQRRSAWWEPLSRVLSVRRRLDQAERLFLTPPRFAAPARERDVLAPGREPERSGSRAPDRDVDVGRGPGSPARPRLGRPGRPDSGPSSSRWWRRDSPWRASTVPRTGASEGRIATIPELAEALGAVADALGPVRGIIAHSGGGAVSGWAFGGACSTASWTCRRPSRWWRPAARFRGYFERFKEASGLSPPRGAPGPPAGGAGRGAVGGVRSARASPPTCRWRRSWCTIGRTRRCAGRRARR